MPSNNLLTLCVRNAIQLAGALTYGTKILPYDESKIRQATTAVKPAVIKQWPIQRENFVDDVVKGYNDMRCDEVRELVAGTGVGKTTKVPYAISSATGDSGLMLMPDGWSPFHTLNFVQKSFRDMGGTVEAVMLRTTHMLHPVAKPHVYFCAAVDFLARLYMHPDLMRDLNIKYIVLDEAHVPRPDYKVFAMLRAAKVFTDVKIFRATATAVEDLSMESNGMRTVVAKSPALLDPSALDALKPVSPMHHSQIASRVMIFFATDAEIINAHEYYKRYDIPVMAITHIDSSVVLDHVDKYLTSNPLCVLLVYNRFATSYTFNVDVAICTGYTLEVKTDFMSSKVNLVRRAVTSAERTQRMGRVGRYKQGKAFYADVPLHIAPAIDHDVQFYVYLWLKLFNVNTNDPSIVMFASMLGDLSHKAVAMLLNARVPPVMLLPYVADTGFYANWDDVLKNALYSGAAMASEESNADMVVKWPLRSTGPVDYSERPISYRALVEVAKEFVVLQAAAWMVYSKDGNLDDPNFDTRSVITAVQDRVLHKARPASYVPVLGHTSLIRDIPPVDVSPMYDPSLKKPTVTFNTATRAKHVSRASGTTIELPAEPDVVERVTRAMSTMTMLPKVEIDTSPVVRDLPILGWAENVTTTRSRRVESDDSSDRDAITLQQVDPRHYQFYKLFPMDSILFDLYMSDSAVTKRDKARVKKMLLNRKDFSAMPTSDDAVSSTQSEYFLSALRCHNSAVTRYLQRRSRPTNGVLSRMLGLEGDDIMAEKKAIVESSKLLYAMHIENYFVGVDKRVLAGLQESPMLSPIYDTFLEEAMVSMAFGPEFVKKQLLLIADACELVKSKGKVVANAWWFGSNLIIMRHVFDTVRDNYRGYQVIDVPGADLVILRDDDQQNSSFVIRKLFEVERVYVLTYSPLENNVLVLGPFELSGDDDFAFVSHAFVAGTSGALMVGVDDAAILGFYVGPCDDECGRVQLAHALSEYL